MSKPHFIPTYPGSLSWRVVDGAVEIGLVLRDGAVYEARHPGGAPAGRFATIVEAGRALKNGAREAALRRLTAEWEVFADRVGFTRIGSPLGSADEHLADERLSPEERDYVARFVARWDAAVRDRA